LWSDLLPSPGGPSHRRYQNRFGFEDNIRDFENAGIAPFQATMADHLKALGYGTYALGKWHLGDEPAFHPNQRGFDEFIGFIGGSRTYYNYDEDHPDYDEDDMATPLQHNGTPIEEGANQYLTTVFGRAATNFIDSHTTNSPDAPFFMYLAFNAVYTPLDPDYDYEDDDRIQDIEVQERKKLATMTISMDDAVGMVLDKITAPNWSDNGPLHEGKTSLYEGAFESPSWSTGPEKFQSRRAGACSTTRSWLWTCFPLSLRQPAVSCSRMLRQMVPTCYRESPARQPSPSSAVCSGASAAL
jgi:arylsulfatase A-like enzyme